MQTGRLFLRTVKALLDQIEPFGGTVGDVKASRPKFWPRNLGLDLETPWPRPQSFGLGLVAEQVN